MKSASMPTSEERGRGPSLTLGQKLGGTFLLLTILALGLCGLVIVNLNRVRLDARKFMEETREARLAHSLLSRIEQIQEPALFGTARMSQLLGEAHGLLGELGEGPPGDPSGAEHQSSERRMVAELRRDLDQLGPKGPPALDGLPGELEGLLDRIRAVAIEIKKETDQEAAWATRDLERRARGLVFVMVAAGATSVAVLVLLSMLVHRNVVRPVRALREGTRRFAGGELEHRIETASRDELGELAREFNRMAERLNETHKVLEERVRERTRQFVRAARLADMGTLAAGIAHEVNTPLASIASCAEGLERRITANELDRDGQLEYLRTIAREAYRAHAITGHLLAFAREDPGPVGPVRVEDAVDEVARLLRQQMEDKQTRLERDIEPELPPVSANRSELQQVILNVVKNALDANRPGDAVRIACRRKGADVELDVRDAGPGVLPDDLKRIFDPFFTTKEPGQGTGLGLSLVYRIVESYGGRIEVRNAPDRGAIFRIVLPIADVGRAEDA